MKTVLISIPNHTVLIKKNALGRLAQEGFRLIVNPSGITASREFIAQHLPFSDALIAGGETIDAPLMDVAQELRVIARYGVGTDNIDIPYATGKGIYVTVTAGANANSVAEHAVMLTLGAMRQLKHYIRGVESGAWRIDEFNELAGKTVGLIGFGRIGRLAARRFSGFEPRIVAYDPFLSAEEIKRGGAEPVDIAELLRVSDIVSLHLPCTEATRGFLGRDRLHLMKRTSMLVNTSRGALVDEKALYDALTDGTIAGAGLDVVAEEPCSAANPLLKLDNVIITPHIAGGSYENHEKAGEICVDAVISAIAGRCPENAVNADDVIPARRAGHEGI